MRPIGGIMRIEISGAMANRHSLLKNCVETILPDSTMLGNEYKGMTVNVNVLSEMDGAGAIYVDPMECVPDAETPPSKFTIHLKRQSFMKVVTTLCHELVHVVQFRKGEAYYLPCGGLTYLGIVIDPKMYNNPMEWAAFGREKFLAQQFCEEHRLTREQWYACPFTA